MISDLIISYSGQRKTINIPVLYLELLEDYNTAVMLNQLIYWSDRSSRTDGYFFKSYKEWNEELFLSQYQVKKAINKLKEIGLVETKLKKSYGSPTLHYKANMEEISKWIMKKLDKRKSRNLINDYQKTSYSLTENTTKNTTDIKSINQPTNINTKKELPQQDSSNRNINNLENEYEYIISYFNQKTNKSFKATSKRTRELINGRLNEGYTLEDFKHVIDIKTEQWLNNEKMDKHLAPITLFRPSNFEKYLNEKPTKPKGKSYLTDLMGGNK